MRLISENKSAIRTAPHEVTCRPQHKIYVGVGTTCPSCGIQPGTGPWSFQDYERIFGGPVNAPPIREPRPEHVVAQAKYVAADRERVAAIRDVARLEDELSRAGMGTTEYNALHGARSYAPDEAQISRLTSQLTAAREAVEAAEERTVHALRASHRVKA